MIVDETLTASVLNTVIVKVADTSEACFADCENGFALLNGCNADNLVALGKLDCLNASCGSAYRSCVVLIETNGHTFLGRNNYIVVALCHLDPCKLVALIKSDCDNACAADISVLGNCRTLDNTVTGKHTKIFVVIPSAAVH